MTSGLSRLAVVAPVALLWACDESDWIPTGSGTVIGSGVIATEARPVAGFTGLSVSHPAQVIVVCGGAESLEVSADDNVLPLVRSEVLGGRLFLAQLVAVLRTGYTVGQTQVHGAAAGVWPGTGTW